MVTLQNLFMQSNLKKSIFKVQNKVSGTIQVELESSVAMMSVVNDDGTLSAGN